MDNSRIKSPLPSHGYGFNSHRGPQSPANRSPPHASSPFGTSAGPISMPGARIAPPPPLPPPRHPGVAAGSDLALHFANSVHNQGKSGTGSVIAGSSLLGGYNRVKQENRDYEGPGSFRRDSSSLTIKPDMLPDTELKYDMFRNRDEGYHSMPVSSLTNSMSVSLGSLPTLLALYSHGAGSPKAALWPCRPYVAASTGSIKHRSRWVLVFKECPK